MNFIGGVIGGAIAGILGAILWAAIAYYGQVEIGWIAWGIGAAVGIGVSMGSKGGGILPALIAVLITAVSLCGGKYLAVRMAVSQFDTSAVLSGIEIGEEECIASLAYAATESQLAEGKQLKFRNGARSLDDVSDIGDYPAAIEKLAKSQWKAMSNDEREEYKASRVAELEAGLESFKSAVTQRAFMDSFSGFDILFFLLGILSAGKIALSDEE